MCVCGGGGDGGRWGGGMAHADKYVGISYLMYAAAVTLGVRQGWGGWGRVVGKGACG